MKIWCFQQLGLSCPVNKHCCAAYVSPPPDVIIAPRENIHFTVTGCRVLHASMDWNVLAQHVVAQQHQSNTSRVANSLRWETKTDQFDFPTNSIHAGRGSTAVRVTCHNRAASGTCFLKRWDQLPIVST